MSQRAPGVGAEREEVVERGLGGGAGRLQCETIERRRGGERGEVQNLIANGDTAKVTIPDVFRKNGVIMVVDKVLMPK